ncbi:MAG: CoA-transferase [Candidatus Bathyarchaeia archaeon]
MSEKATPFERMIISAARELPNNTTIFVGVGIPLYATIFAMKYYNLNITALIEGGNCRTIPPRRPPIIMEAHDWITMADWNGTMIDAFSMAQRGLIEYGFISGGQCDKYGNVNSTCAGNYHKPFLRWPGGGGAGDVASLCKKTIIIMPQNKLRLRERVDFITAPGYLDGPGARERAGLPPGTGPIMLITQLGVYRFDENTKELYLSGYYSGVTIEEIKQNTGFDVKISPKVREIEEPTPDEIKNLREILKHAPMVFT